MAKKKTTDAQPVISDAPIQEDPELIVQGTGTIELRSDAPIQEDMLTEIEQIDTPEQDSDTNEPEIETEVPEIETEVPEIETEVPTVNHLKAAAIFEAMPHVTSIWFDEEGGWRFYETLGSTPIHK